MVFNYSLIPKNDIKARAIRPVRMNEIPSPLNGAGIFEYLIFSLIAAIPMIAMAQPTPEPTPNTVACASVGYSLSCIKSEPPKIAQFTAIRGRKIPSELYKAGENFSMIISTNCVIEAIVAINIMKLKKLRSISAKEGEIQLNAPGDRR
jgi:hypothetical protein